MKVYLKAVLILSFSILFSCGSIEKYKASKDTKKETDKETIFTHSKDTVFIKEKAKEEIKEDVKHKESDNTTLFIWLGLGGLLLILLFMFFAMMFMVKNISAKIPSI